LFEMFEAGGRRPAVGGSKDDFLPAADRRLPADLIIERAIRVKVKIVDADEREADLRRLLNYGHTISHGIENAMSYAGITHGAASCFAQLWVSPSHFFVQSASFFWHSAAAALSQLLPFAGLVSSANALIVSASSAATAKTEILFICVSFDSCDGWARAKCVS